MPELRADQTRSLPLQQIDERLQRYRLQSPRAEKALAQSLARYGQICPIVVCRREDQFVLIDGFKRLHAARQLKGVTELTARCVQLDEQGAKAAIYQLNRVSQRPQEIEEAWIVYSLVREDGLSQVDVAQLLGRHKSWVNRRLAMFERLAPAAKEELQLGLLSPSLARQLVRLPMGNQDEALHAAREAALTPVELSGVVDLLLASSSDQQRRFVLEQPRQALRQSQGSPAPSWDPRLSAAGNQAAKRLAGLLDQLAKMQSWLRYRGRGALMACDREPLKGGFERLARECETVAEAAGDFVRELRSP